MRIRWTAVVAEWVETVEEVIDVVVPVASNLRVESKAEIFFLDHAQSSSIAPPLSQRRIFETCGFICVAILKYIDRTVCWHL